MLDLNDLQVFERVAALGNFSEAARGLGLPKSNADFLKAISQPGELWMADPLDEPS